MRTGRIRSSASGRTRRLTLTGVPHPRRHSLLLIPLVIAAAACSGGDDDAGTEIQIDDQVVVDPDAVAAAREQVDNADDVEAASAPVETEPAASDPEPDDEGDQADSAEPTDEAPETTIEIAEAEEDELDSLLNSLTVFNSCLAEDGFEFMGAPGIDGASAEEFEQPYLQSLGRCAAVSNIAASIQSFGEAQASLTPEEIEQTNFGLPVFRECLIGLGWTVGELVPDERGALGFDGQLQPPDGGLGVNTDDITDCRLEAEQYVADSFEADA